MSPYMSNYLNKDYKLVFKWIRTKWNDHYQNCDHNGVLSYVVDVGLTFIISAMDLVNKSNVNEFYCIGLAIQL